MDETTPTVDPTQQPAAPAEPTTAPPADPAAPAEPNPAQPADPAAPETTPAAPEAPTEGGQPAVQTASKIKGHQKPRHLYVSPGF